MGKLTPLVYGNSSDEIPQPTSVLLGSNLTKNLKQPSKQQKHEPSEEQDQDELTEEQAYKKHRERLRLRSGLPPVK